MFNRLMMGLILSAGLSPLCRAEEPAAAKKLAWGHVKGQVVFKGQLDDARLRKYFEDLHIHARLTRKKAEKGVEPRMINVIPNETLIVDPKSLGIKNALVYLKKRPERVHPDFAKKPSAPVTLTYANRQFGPRVFALQVGQTLTMNVDKVSDEPTNFHAQFGRNNNFNVLLRPMGPVFEYVPKNAEIVPALIQSSIYPTAKAYCLIQDHPYVTLTDHQGRFVLKNLPAGEHELTIWHETVGYVARSLKVEVTPGTTQELPPNTLTTEQVVK